MFVMSYDKQYDGVILCYQTKYNWELFDTPEEINFTLIFIYELSNDFA